MAANHRISLRSEESRRIPGVVRVSVEPETIPDSERTILRNVVHAKNNSYGGRVGEADSSAPPGRLGRLPAVDCASWLRPLSYGFESYNR